MRGRPAVEQAILLLIVPSAARAIQDAPLPDDIESLLRILARDPAAEAEASARFRRPPETLHAAAEFYATQILFCPQASAYRALAAEPGCSRELLRSHLALLLQWLHPDRRVGDEHDLVLERVIRAWNVLQTPESRAEYDRGLAVSIQSRAALQSRAVRAAYPPTNRTRKAHTAFRLRWRPLVLTLAVALSVAVGIFCMALALPQ